MPDELIPYLSRIKTEMHMIEIDMIELLEASTIREFHNDPCIVFKKNILELDYSALPSEAVSSL